MTAERPLDMRLVRTRFRRLAVRSFSDRFFAAIAEKAVSFRPKAMYRRFLQIVRFGKVEWLEVFIVLMTGAWGLWLILPWYDPSEKALYPVFRTLLEVATNETWAGIFVVLAWLQMSALLTNSTRFRKGAAMLMVSLWLVVAVLFWLGDFHAISVPTSIVMLISSLTLRIMLTCGTTGDTDASLE